MKVIKFLRIKMKKTYFLLIFCFIISASLGSCTQNDLKNTTDLTDQKNDQIQSEELVETDQQYEQLEVIIQDNKIYFPQSVVSVKVETVTLGYKTTLETNVPLSIDSIVECFEQIDLPSPTDRTNDANGGSTYIYFFFENYTYMVIQPNCTMERTSLIINGEFYNLDSEQYDKINEVLSWRLR